MTDCRTVLPRLSPAKAEMESHQCPAELAKLAAFGETDGQTEQEEDDTPGDPSSALKDQVCQATADEMFGYEGR